MSTSLYQQHSFIPRRALPHHGTGLQPISPAFPSAPHSFTSTALAAVASSPSSPCMGTALGRAPPTCCSPWPLRGYEPLEPLVPWVLPLPWHPWCWEAAEWGHGQGRGAWGGPDPAVAAEVLDPLPPQVRNLRCTRLGPTACSGYKTVPYWVRKCDFYCAWPFSPQCEVLRASSPTAAGWVLLLGPCRLRRET